MATKVVHCKKEKFDEYIGRPSGNVKFHYGNPFSHKNYSKALVILPENEDCVEACRKWLEGQDYGWVEPERRQWILDNLHKLKDKILGCWCNPKPCHGHVYVYLIDKLKL